MGRSRQTKIGDKKQFLTVLSEFYEDKVWYLNCICDCGNLHRIRDQMFGRTQSCGCRRLLGLGSTKHALSDTVEYETWSSMRKRCNFEWHHAYHNYGGRGIKVRERWDNLENGFLNFLEDMGERPSKQHSLDRINVDDDYYKENCRWTDWKTQSNNKRTNVYVEIEGVTKTLSEWCEIYGKSIQMISHRVHKLNMDYQEALETPKLKNKGKNKPKDKE